MLVTLADGTETDVRPDNGTLVYSNAAGFAYNNSTTELLRAELLQAPAKWELCLFFQAPAKWGLCLFSFPLRRLSIVDIRVCASLRLPWAWLAPNCEVNMEKVPDGAVHRVAAGAGARRTDRESRQDHP